MTTILIALFVSQAAFAATTMKMNYKNSDISTVIREFAGTFGEKFVVSPKVRGKISIFSPKKLERNEAYNQLSTALAINGYAITLEGNTHVIRNARVVSRGLLEVSRDVPQLKPERMYTWIYQAQNISASDLLKDLRLLASKDGEVSVHRATNQLVFTDWVTNIHRISSLIKAMDIKVSKTIEKLKVKAKKSARK